MICRGGVVPVLTSTGRKEYCAECLSRLSQAGSLANCIRCNRLFLVDEDTLAQHASHAVVTRRKGVIGHATTRHYSVLGASPAWLRHMAEHDVRVTAHSGLTAIMWCREPGP